MPGDRCSCCCNGSKTESAVFVAADIAQQLPADAVLGRVFGEKYAVINLLGSGGFGAVYCAIQKPIGREVALKVIRAEAQDNVQLQARFFREAKAVARLSHPGAVTLHDYGAEPDGTLYMVFERVVGLHLCGVLQAAGCFQPDRAARVAIQILAVLSEAHRLGLVHRDLKPANIMLVKGEWGNESVKVLDFGIAKVLCISEDRRKTVETPSGTILGTPQYMAPEQARTGDVETRSDLYAMGVVLYEMLTGHPPFTGPTPFSILTAHVHNPVPPFPPLLQVPEMLTAVVKRALAKRPADRFTDALDMARAIEEAVPTGLLHTGVRFGLPLHLANAETIDFNATGMSSGSTSQVMIGQSLTPASDTSQPTAWRVWRVFGVTLGLVFVLVAFGGMWLGTHNGTWNREVAPAGGSSDSSTAPSLVSAVPFDAIAPLRRPDSEPDASPRLLDAAASPTPPKTNLRPSREPRGASPPARRKKLGTHARSKADAPRASQEADQHRGLVIREFE